MIVEKISRFVASPQALSSPAGVAEESMAFESLALAAFAYQFDRLAPYRAMCERAGKSPSSVTSWRDVPMIPAAA
ncbi:MAG: hypothetical protein KBA72_15205, partial [Thermoanaerobaculia bacterium]|nr:hypothetical protein [Thermoanaerobaculia bacterium]